MNSRQKKIISLWLYSGLFLVIAMVLIGGITRLTHSGLSIVEWKLISGAIPPLNETEWQDTFTKYQQFPEYQKINTDMSLTEFKSIFFWEYLHRLLGRLIGVVFIVPFLLYWKKNWLDSKLKKQLIFLLLLGGLQGFLGWFMVKSGLVDVPAVSHFRLAIHLIMIIEIRQKEKFPNSQINKLSKGFIVLLVIQIIYGAFTAGLKAGYLLPKGAGITESLFGYTLRNSSDFNLLNNGFDIQAFHRLFAWFVFFFAIYIWKKAKDTFLQQASLLLVLIISLQIVLGIITLLFGVPIFFALLLD